ncbi:MAG: sterol carrier protein domain-containing protein [Proteobacteria bacterium]|nr:sterol carrier protein domain-containing protein [Pseudomonadota bacterium]
MNSDNLQIRDYVEARDLKALQRVWHEVGWIHDESGAGYMGEMLKAGTTLTGVVGEEAECMVNSMPGLMRHQNRDLRASVVTAVTVNRVGRKSGFALNLTARALAASFAEGACVSTLGMFDQGFYNLLGFGTGSYEHFLTFDPKTLKTTAPYRRPSRLGRDDWKAVHGAMLNRSRAHGGVLMDPELMIKAELGWSENGSGLGYFEGDKLTHFIWFSAQDVERGPYRIEMQAYRNVADLAELLTLIKSLGDQVYSMTMCEPPEIQLQALLEVPFRNRFRTIGSKHEYAHKALAWWQVRLLDVCKAVKGYHSFVPVMFNLHLSDPIENYLPQNASWHGVGGDYIVSLDENSSARRGLDANLPHLHADIGAFSRLFFGVVPATSLADTEALQADPALLSQLDVAFGLPRSAVGLNF